LQIPTQKGNNYNSFAIGRKQLFELLDGKIVYDDKKNTWYFKHGRMKFSIGTTSEGIKKLAIFNQLLANHYLTSDSVIFIDEVESALHPQAISKFLDIIYVLSQAGVQFFLTTHSYFVIKKLALLSKKSKESMPVLSLSRDGSASYEDMLDGMPNNSIIDEAVRLYSAEVDLAMEDE
jgi:predicted ATPase